MRRTLPMRSPLVKSVRQMQLKKPPLLTLGQNKTPRPLQTQPLPQPSPPRQPYPLRSLSQ